jgi:FMN-dependent NADH-azoreductase
MLSKAKWHELCEAYKEKYNDEEVESILLTLKEVLQIDPTLSTYDDKQAKHIKNYRQKKKEERKALAIST